ncbi:hypothetical protein DK254_00375 [Pseudomonas sp. RW407]|uniref:hypothetical protein n=1 Tax=Pseudomonas sp. RW407 TaxID=2202894 RepID=UPI000D701FAB|nr:hypothetical protein [Pseudomonas sp. RW407]PWU30740.1 hypothetical protein DK254_11795 [Pseudomonas sp. RW407]PWU32173.1 hypothetical protein DK254_00375 [Pseudomonas sp. RW407]
MLDRDIQYRILTMLADAYPTGISNPSEEMELDAKVGAQNFYYLAEHGLIQVNRTREIGPTYPTPAIATITARGLDFLADDGGLGAILGTVTVKLHQDSIKQIIESKIQSSGLPEQEKTGLLKAVRELPGEAMTHLTTKLLDLGMDNLPAAVGLIRKALHHLSQ